MQHKRTMIPRVCRYCSRDFEARLDAINNGRGHFCSPLCARKFGGLNQATRIQTRCERCGGTFKVHPSSVKNGRGKFCSRACAGNGKIAAIEERFWTKVNKTETCWLWTGTRNKLGYGQLSIGAHSAVSAHRISWIINRGPIPAGLWVLHDCPDGDNPSCVNPSHLWLGDHLANERDKTAKGRRPVGELTKSSTLTDAQVLDIRAQYATGNLNQYQLAAKFCVTQSTVGAIVRRTRWTHI